MSEEMSPLQMYYYDTFNQVYEANQKGDFKYDQTYFIEKIGTFYSFDKVLPNVDSAYSYYFFNVQEEDWGCVSAYQVPFQGRITYAVYTTCDGDENWLELYDSDDNPQGYIMIKHRSFKVTDKETLRNWRIGE
ncbi:MAG: hypothetical protein JXJ04_12865 [Spirochaetales bacterium]|nr:hypothetical protein [Spirochaetales bacterium]